MNLNDLRDELHKLPEDATLTVSFYSCGRIHYVPLTEDRIELREDGTVNIKVEDN